MNESPSTCRAVRAVLPMLAGGDAEGDAAGALAHLRRCVACRNEYAGFVGAQGALRRLRGPAPSDAFFDDLAADTLAAVLSAPVPAARREWGSPALWRAFLACACVLAGAGLSMLLERPSVGERLLRAPALDAALGARAATRLSTGWTMPVSLTPSRQGLRGQLRALEDPFEGAPRQRAGDVRSLR